MKEKINLTQLEIQSFITVNQEAKTVRFQGGIYTVSPNCVTRLNTCFSFHECSQGDCG